MTENLFPLSTFVDKQYNPTRLSNEIKAAFPNMGPFRVEHAPDDRNKMSVTTNKALSSAEMTALGAVLSAHASDARHLPTVKDKKFATIDAKTKRLIDQGFVYNSVRHSLSENMQKNLLGAMLIRDNPAIFPIKFNSLDDSADTVISNKTDLEAMYLAAMTALRTAWDAGTAIKDQVRAATTVEQVSAVTDPR